MKSKSHNKISTVEDRANDFLKKKSEEVQQIPVEELKMLVSDLIKTIYTTAELDQESPDQPIKTEIPTHGKISIDEKGFIIHADASIAAMLGKGRKGLLNYPIQCFIQRSHKKRFNQHYLDVIKSGKERDCPIKLVNADGRTIEVYFNLKPQYNDDGCFQELNTSIRLKAVSQ